MEPILCTGCSYKLFRCNTCNRWRCKCIAFLAVKDLKYVHYADQRGNDPVGKLSVKDYKND